MQKGNGICIKMCTNADLEIMSNRGKTPLFSQMPKYSR